MVIDVVTKSKTLHITKLRFRWQVLLLQTLSTISLLFLMRKMSELYGECSEKFIANSGSDGWCRLCPDGQSHRSAHRDRCDGRLAGRRACRPVGTHG